MVAALRERLGIIASFSQPRVSNDTPFSEALFRTGKHVPRWPPGGFASNAAARDWVFKHVEAPKETKWRSFALCSKSWGCRLVWRNNLPKTAMTRPAYIEADLPQIFTNEDAASFAVLWLLIHRTPVSSGA